MMAAVVRRSDKRQIQPAIRRSFGSGKGPWRATYRQGKKQTEVEALELFALRSTDGHGDRVRRALASRGSLTEIDSQHLFILEALSPAGHGAGAAAVAVRTNFKARGATRRGRR
jgi:hypothetical protein